MRPPGMAIVPILLAVLSLAALLPNALLAQERVTAFLGGGLAMGTSDLATDTDGGWLVFGGVSLPVGTDGLSLGVTGSYAEIPYQGGFDEKAQVTTVTADVGFSFLNLVGGGVTPYLRAGAGLRVERYEPGRLAASRTTHSGFGASAGGGIAIPVGGVTAILGAHFVTGRSAGYWGGHGGIGIPVGGSGGGR